MQITVPPLPRIEITSLARIAETRPVALFTDGPAWTAVGGALALPEVWRAEPSAATLEAFESLADTIPAEARVVYAVGGGLPVDAAKLAAHRLGLPLVAVPTALSVDAHLTPASGVRRDGCVHHVETAAPELLAVDLTVIAAAPAWVRAAGICDVLSIATALWDWRFAEGQRQNRPEQPFVPYADRVAEALLTESFAIAASLGTGEPAALRCLLDLLALEVQLCNVVGHSRPEEGSEHAFAYSVENLLGPGLPHGDLVGPGIVAIAAAQGQDPAPLRESLLAGGVRLDRIPREAALTTLRTLPDYARHHGLPFGIAHVLDEARIEAAMRSLW